MQLLIAASLRAFGITSELPPEYSSEATKEKTLIRW